MWRFFILGLSAALTVSAACPTLQMFAVRGTTEGSDWPGIFGDSQGLLGFVTSGVLPEVPGSNTTGIKYPASFDGNSELYGIGNLTETLKSFNAQCPDSKIAIMGYSQGAEVLSDTLCGRDEATLPYMAPISAEYTRNVIAAVGVADPTWVQGLVGVERFGNATGNGSIPRHNLDDCAAYTGRYGHWCTALDAVCDNVPGAGFAAHFQEVQIYQYEMVDYIVAQYYAAINETDPYYSLISGTTSATAVPPSSTTVVSVPVTTTSLSSPTSILSAIPNTIPVYSTATPPYLNTTTSAPSYGNSTTTGAVPTSTTQKAAGHRNRRIRTLYGVAAAVVSTTLL